MTNDPTLEHVIVSTEISPLDRFKKAIAKHKTTIVLGTALAASLAMNVLQSIKPEGTAKYFLTPEDVDYLNRLLEEDQKEE